MAQDFLEYKIRKQFASIDRLITDLVITRKYIYSAQIGLTRCRDHLAMGMEAGSPPPAGEQYFVKGQEELLNKLKMVEKSIKKQLRDSSRELGCICARDRAAK